MGNKFWINRSHGLYEWCNQCWKDVFVGDWVDFINQHVPASGWVDNFQPLKRVDIGYQKGVVYTPQSLQYEINRELKTCGIWTLNEANGPESANMKSLKAKLQTMRAYLTNYGSPEWVSA